MCYVRGQHDYLSPSQPPQVLLAHPRLPQGARETPCKPSKCPDYVSVARAKRERDAKERKRIERLTQRVLAG